ncbi:hypothetical protein, partial [Escherichia coli]|uniref:hypothetical protein n=1 Tax=Escherichia coli TaxID=562 RepID=UPI001BDDBDB1
SLVPHIEGHYRRLPRMACLSHAPLDVFYHSTRPRWLLWYGVGTGLHKRWRRCGVRGARVVLFGEFAG